MISIIIPVYNHGHALRRCLQSIRQQSFTDFEVIIVDDGSAERIETIGNNFKNFWGNRLLFRRQTHQGANSARNLGASLASGNFLLFCDADVVLKPQALEIMQRSLKAHPEASYVYCAHKYGFKIFRLWPFDGQKLRNMPYIHSTSLLRRDHFPGWDENIKRLQDWDLWLTMLEQGHIGCFIDQVLFTVAPGGTMSRWLPSIAYKFLPFLPAVKKYQKSMKIIKAKHKLS
jgi:glycosyltransferase involved in cell wall biosynthesis